MSGPARADILSVADLLARGGIAVVPTDTLYGVVGSALWPETVERVYRVRGRDAGKPMIILISDVAETERFGVRLDGRRKEALGQLWPGRVSVVLDCDVPEYEYLHRGTGTLAFRLPDDSGLRGLSYEVGPLVAPSANPQGAPPAGTVEEARAYFGDRVDEYVDGGKRTGEPSTLVSLDSGGRVTVLRPGAVSVIAMTSDR